MALNLVIQRLFNQQLIQPRTNTFEEVVGWFGAVQAQDYAAAKWAVGQRTSSARDADLEQAFNRGAILRTHLMRPTWHFVLPEDIRWILDLTASRVKTAISSYKRQLELDGAVFAKSNEILRGALEGGNFLTRAELASILARSGINNARLRLNYLLIEAELDQVLCSGPRRGKQFTYALIDERAPQARILAREEALAELARRYFTSHGPALLKDFTWWSGLAAADARDALQFTSSVLNQETVDGQTYWFADLASTTGDSSPSAALLPNYDEFTVGYADRSAMFEDHQLKQIDTRGGVLGNIMILDGCLVGTWKRTFRGREVLLETRPFHPLSDSENLSFSAVAQRYKEFLG